MGQFWDCPGTRLGHPLISFGTFNTLNDKHTPLFPLENVGQLWDCPGTRLGSDKIIHKTVNYINGK